MTLMDFDLNAIGPDYLADPYPTLAALRAAHPIHRNPDGSVFLTRHADCQAVYRSRAMLSDKTAQMQAKFGDCPLRDHHTTSLVFNDPPYHTVVRKLLAAAFTPRKLAELEPVIAGIVADLLDGIEGKRRFDLVADYASVLPTEIISSMLGIPQTERHRLRPFSFAILGALDPVVSDARLAEGNAAVTEFSDLLRDIISHRRQNPGSGGAGEVLEALIFGEHDGRRLTEDELIQNCIFLLNAGHETTTSLVSNTIGCLMEFPSEMAKLRADPGLIGQAVEESLRFESPVQMGNRLAAEDLETQSGVIPRGTYIHTSIAGANRDPDVFDAPERFDISRAHNPHLAFITGIHVCLGATLARIEGRLAIGGFVRRFPRMEPDGAAQRLPLARFRGFHAMPVRV